MVTSASITQSGTTFHIQQNVTFNCILPVHRVVASEFVVGPLAPGSYSVVATIHLSGVPAEACPSPVLTQGAAFVVASAVPFLSTKGLLLFALLSGVAGMVAMQLRG